MKFPMNAAKKSEIEKRRQRERKMREAREALSLEFKEISKKFCYYSRLFYNFLQSITSHTCRKKVKKKTFSFIFMRDNFQDQHLITQDRRKTFFFIALNQFPCGHCGMNFFLRRSYYSALSWRSINSSKILRTYSHTHTNHLRIDHKDSTSRDSR